MAQGLDRRLTIGPRDPADNSAPALVADIAVWGTRRDASIESRVQVGGSRAESLRTVIVRWRPDIEATTPNRMRFVDDGVPFNVISARELTDRGRARRRWLELTGVASR